MSIDHDRIKRRIRGLLNLAADDGAANGEIDNAMRMAAQLMEEHHLSEADVEAKAQASAVAQPDIRMDTATAPAVGQNFSTWESSLSGAVENLVGSVKRYVTRETVKTGSFGAPVFKKCVKFYGPAEDAALAAEIFGEWAHVISALATGKYGGCFRGDGAMYAYGFAQSLSEKASAAKRAREHVVTDSTRALVFTGGAGSLAQVLEHKRELAATWLEKDRGIKLVSGGRRSGYSSGSHDARSEGRRDGSRAEFSAQRRAKLGPA